LDTRARSSEFWAGCREIAPALLGTIPFGFVAGVAAISAGMSVLEGLALSVFSFSGIAQLVVCQLVAADSPAPVVIAAAFVVSLRLLMYSAALSPYLAHLDRRWRAGLAFLMTDQGFALTVKRFGEPGDRSQRHWHFLGSSVTLFVTWQLAVIFGLVAGASVPSSWSLDFAVVLTFIGLLVPVVRTRAELAAAVVASAIALAAAGLPYRLSLVVASLAGIAAGMAIERSRRR
jgi:predicted branched-subunit amino acid permease